MKSTLVAATIGSVILATATTGFASTSSPAPVPTTASSGYGKPAPTTPPPIVLASPKPVHTKHSHPQPSLTKHPKPATSITAHPKPGYPKPATTTPATTKPAATKPAATKPVITKPAATTPVITKPATPKPVGTRPVGPKPTAVTPAPIVTAHGAPGYGKPAHPKVLTLVAADNGRTIHVSRGEQIMVKLAVKVKQSPDPKTWWRPVTVSGDALKALPQTLMARRGMTLARYRVVGSGQAKLSSSRPICPQEPDAPACHSMLGWQVTLDAR
jgi:hypothetical protein